MKQCSAAQRSKHSTARHSTAQRCSARRAPAAQLTSSVRPGRGRLRRSCSGAPKLCMWPCPGTEPSARCGWVGRGMKQRRGGECGSWVACAREVVVAPPPAVLDCAAGQASAGANGLGAGPGRRGQASLRAGAGSLVGFGAVLQLAVAVAAPDGIHNLQSEAERYAA